LARVANDDLGPALVGCDGSADLHWLPFQCLKVPEFGAIGGKNHACECAGAVVGAKIEKSISRARCVNAENAASDAPQLAGALSGVVKVHTVAACLDASLRGGLATCAQAIADQAGDQGQGQRRDCYPWDKPPVRGWIHFSSFDGGGNGGLPARTQAVYQSELTNETAALIRSSATGAANFSKAGKNPGSR